MEDEVEDSTQELPPDNTGEVKSEKDSQDGAEGDPKLEKRLKDTQAAFTRKSQENAELRRELSEIKGKLDAVIQLRGQRDEQNQPDPLAFLDDPKQVETLLDDPENVARGLKTVVGAFGRTLESRDAALLKAVKEIIANTGIQSPVAVKVAEMKKEKAYEGLPDNVLEKIALNLVNSTASKSEDDEDEDDDQEQTRFRGAPAGGKKFSRAAGGKGKSEVDQLADKFYKRLYKEDYKESK